jgi:hypothetical protein
MGKPTGSEIQREASEGSHSLERVDHRDEFHHHMPGETAFAGRAVRTAAFRFATRQSGRGYGVGLSISNLSLVE